MAGAAEEDESFSLAHVLTEAPLVLSLLVPVQLGLLTLGTGGGGGPGDGRGGRRANSVSQCGICRRPTV